MKDYTKSKKIKCKIEMWKRNSNYSVIGNLEKCITSFASNFPVFSISLFHIFVLFHKWYDVQYKKSTMMYSCSAKNWKNVIISFVSDSLLCVNRRSRLNHVKFLKQPIIYSFFDDKNKEKNTKTKKLFSLS